MEALSKLNSKLSASSERQIFQKKMKKKRQDVKPFSSNNTLLFFQGVKKPHYYLTAYARVKVISISGISYQEMSANLNCQFQIDISYRRLTSEQKNQMLNQGIRISFQVDNSIILTRDNADVSIYDNQNQKRITYVVRKFVQTKLQCEKLFLSPFQVIKCQIGLKINKLKLQCSDKLQQQNKAEQADLQAQDSKINYVFGDKNKKKQQKLEQKGQDQQNQKEKHHIFVHFNMMDHPDTQVKIQTSMDSNFGLFQIATSLLNAKYTTNFNPVQEKEVVKENAKKSKKKKDNKKVSSQNAAEYLPLIKRKYGKQKLEEFNVAIFEIPLYKKPVVANLTIFLPLFVLAIINLGIFYEEPDLHKRIVSIAAIMVSFMALIPTIREQIPPTPIITLVQILVFSQSITTIFALFDSLRVINVNPDGWDFDGGQNVLFLLSLIITIVVNLIVGILSLLFMFSWKPGYIDQRALEQQQFTEDYRLNIYEWSNKQADVYYNRFYMTNSIQVLQDSEQKRAIIVGNIFNIAKSKENQKYQEEAFMMQRSDSMEAVRMK